jgi:hypothetical protein
LAGGIGGTLPSLIVSIGIYAALSGRVGTSPQATRDSPPR